MGLQECELKLDHAQRELRPHGTREFPCAGYGAHYTNSEEDAVPWHWHEELELVYVQAGRLKLQIPGKTFCLGPGDGFATNSNILHAANAEQSSTAYSLVFHPLLVAGSGESVFADKYIAPLTRSASFDGCLFESGGKGESSFAGAFQSAFEALSTEGVGYEFTVREQLSRICLLLCGVYEEVLGAGYAQPDQDGIRLRRMLDCIHSRFAEALPLAQIARAADIGQRECLRCFHRSMQTSPIQYLIKYRATQGASLLLRNPGDSVAEIATQCGFDSPSHFAQTFKYFYKSTPREYRKRRNENRAQP